MTTINITDLTNGTNNNNTWEGTGVFDKLISAVNENIDIQFKLGRIKGTDYANVYLGSMQAVLSESMQFVLQQKLLEAQINNADKDTELKEKNILLTLAQTGKTKIEADVTAVMGVKDGNIKDQQLHNMTVEGKILDQKVVGRKQSAVNAE